jgi:hypothetical protein
MGIVATMTRAARRAVRAVTGEATELPPHLVARYPELQRARWRCGGLPVRVGGWSCLAAGEGRTFANGCSYAHVLRHGRGDTP